MDGYEVDFIPLSWVERAAAWPGLTVHAYPIVIERRNLTRRGNDRIEKLLRTILECPDAT